MNQDKYCSEEKRLESFNCYKSTDFDITNEIKENYARAGFYWTGEGEEVKCNFCHLKLHRLQRGDEDPINLHCKYNSTCQFICRNPTDNKPIDEELLEKMLPPKSKFVAGTRRAKHPDYSTKESRLHSFRRWPKNHCISPEKLVSAGFFYLGYRDVVGCYFCGLGLEKFDKDEIPLETHKKLSNDCLFIQNLKDCEINNKGMLWTVKNFATLGKQTFANVWETRRS